MKLMTVANYAKRIGKSKSWVKKLVYAGKLEAVKINARLLLIKVKEEDL
jgi:hypothetical protein